MKKQIITNIIIVLLLVLVLALAFGTSIVSGQDNKTYTKEELITLINEAKDIKTNAHTMATSARALGWEEDDKLIKELQDRWHAADADEKKYQPMLDKILEDEIIQAEKEAAAAARAEEALWTAKSVEYPAATEIWRYMKSLGWNDYVCAGIMGNLMTEVGGQTLNIRYTASSSNYYGMCQWNRAYSQIWGAGLESQCEFLGDTIKYEFDTYGFKYQKGFNFNSFLNMTDAQQAALAFAKCYERCGSGSYGVRQNNAIKAYNYFVN